jgi:hypothetical protein
MGKCDFVELVKDLFGYLIKEYGFSVALDVYDVNAFGNSLVKFRSETVELEVVLDRGQVFINMEPNPNLADSRFSLPFVVDFLAPDAKEPVYIFPKEWDDYSEMIKWQTNRLARVLQQYCEPVLTGQFSQWQAIDELVKRGTEETYVSIVGKEPIRIESRDIEERIEKEIGRRKQT